MVFFKKKLGLGYVITCSWFRTVLMNLELETQGKFTQSLRESTQGLGRISGNGSKPYKFNKNIIFSQLKPSRSLLILMLVAHLIVYCNNYVFWFSGNFDWEYLFRYSTRFYPAKTIKKTVKWGCKKVKDCKRITSLTGNID